ncbi:type VI-A CRISPR-associated RNA-guided ribonuclease Cas13a [Carnobacterium gallinarum]|uniref:type VI-A CRISPR-associated RNA-guided ribonuclease Cas13a n=1 Tax=Carnobacterium gallinarum TaxID=2749 RepID=UPI0005516E8D|nr:type VI-A CRISPR-associated RNA-guided ribonuclease Cas13a [Carnobacterium gallinarum]
MRMTKVKINGSPVSMNRSKLNGHLVWNGTTNTVNILTKKEQSFAASFLNKTLVKADQVKGYKVLAENIFIIFEQLEKSNSEKPSVYLNNIRRLKEAGLKRFFKSKYHEEIKYTSEKNQSVPTKLNLIPLFFNAVDRIQEDKFDEKNWSYFCKEMSPYLDYKKSYLNRKKEILANSIQQNRGFSMPTAEEPNLLSKRKQLFQQWAMKFQESPLIQQNNFAVEQFNKEFANKINELAAVYNVDELCTAITEKLMNFDKDKSNKTRNFEIKKLWKQHPHNKDKALIKLFNQEGNEALNQFNIELGKYFEHYFPKTGKKESAESYYLNPQTIIKTVGYQLRNAFVQYLLQVGKLHQYNKGVLDSQTLQEIGMYEGFQTKFMDACVFASSSLRNIIQATTNEDILTREKFKKELEKNVELKHDLFFKTEIVEERDENPAKKIAMTPNELDLWAIRGAVQRVRNQIFHQQINKRHEPNQLKVGSFENGDLGNVSYQKTIYQKLFDAEIKDIEIYFAEKIKSSGALEQYSMKDLEKLFSNKELTLSLGGQVVAFAPSYKKLYKQGYFYQNEKTIELEQFTDYDFSNDVFKANYYLIKLIYHYVFLPQFSQANNKLFKDTVHYVIQQNKELNTTEKDKKNNKKIRKYAFEQVKLMKNESPEKYMQYLQREMQEERTIKEAKKTNEEKPNYNFEKLLIQIFIKGFDTFLRNFDLNLNPAEELVGTVKEKAEGLRKRKERIAKILNVDEQIKTGDEEIAFWIFAKLLDARHLSELRNEMIKFKQSSVKKGLIKNGDLIEQMQPILELCILSNDSESMEKESFDKIEVFLEKVELAKNEPYMQEDKLTPVKFRFMKQLEKYQTRNFIENLVIENPEFKVSEKIVLNWHEEKEKIADLVDKRTKLHEEWASKAREIEEYNEKIKKNKSKKLDKPAEFAKFAEYKIICEAIENFNRLDHKVRLTYLKNLHYLMIDLMGRMVGFSVLFERDFVYMGRSYSALKKQSIYLNDYDTFANIRDWEVNENKHLFGTSSSDLTFQETAEFKNLKKPMENQLKALLGVTNHSFEIRNNIAHLHVLRNDGKGEGVSLLSCMNDLRKLMSYDRKLKNAVTKAIIKILDKHGMILKLTNNDHTKPFEIESLKPKKIIHLEKSNHSFPMDQVSQEYCDLVKKMLVFTN